MLTSRQQACLKYIEAYRIDTAGVSPSVREIAAKMRTGPGGAQRLIASLQERGFIHKLPNRPRAIAIVARPQLRAFIFNNDTKEIEPVKTRA